MDPSIELVDAMPSGLEDIRASLVHLSFDIVVTQDDTYVSLGILFENITLRALENAVFSVRLPDGANVSLVECEVEKEGGMILGAPEKRLEGRYCVNTLTDGPFFRCNIGRIEVERDVVIFMKYNFRPIREDNVIHMSLPLPGKQQPPENTIRHKCGINLESRYPLAVMQVSSLSHKIKSRFIARKARIDVSDSLGQGDLDLAIMTLDASRYPPVSQTSAQAFSNLKMIRRSATLPQKSGKVEYAPMAIFEEYCKAEDLHRIRGYKRFSKYSMTSYSPSRSSGASAHSFFLSDSETDDEYELEDDVNDSIEEDTEHGEVPNLEDDFKWFDFGDYSPRTPHDLDLSFESEGQWLSGSHPLHSPTSWLEEDADDEHEELQGDAAKAEKEIYDLMDMSRGYRGAALATASIIISKDRPKLIEISQRPGGLLTRTSRNSTSSNFDVDYTGTTPATPPPTPKHGESSSSMVESVELADKLWELGGQNLDMPKLLEAASAISSTTSLSTRAESGAAAAAGNRECVVSPVYAMTTPPGTPVVQGSNLYEWV
ncbi:hypothetical protein EV426DRAFT_449988 [Tirmania nivea]|nr:hypothetical protein EV426DRAFT_449988 [Tirmania nivea]